MDYHYANIRDIKIGHGLPVAVQTMTNTKTQDISITPIGWTVQQDLLTVHYYTNSYLKTYFQYGEYYFSINLTRVSE